MGLPRDGVVGFQGCNIKALSGSLDTPFSFDESSVKEAVVVHFSFLVSAVLTFRPLFVTQGGCLLMHSELCVKNTPILARSLFVLHGHRFHRDMFVVLIASAAILNFGILSETEDQLNLKYEVYLISLIAEQRFSQFRDVFWWPPRWPFIYSTME